MRLVLVGTVRRPRLTEARVRCRETTSVCEKMGPTSLDGEKVGGFRGVEPLACKNRAAAPMKGRGCGAGRAKCSRVQIG